MTLDSRSAAAASGGPDVVKGIALLIAAVFCFSVLDSLAKTMVQTYPLMMVVWVRYSAHVAIMLVLLLPRMGSRLFATRRPGMQLIRGLALGVSSVTFVAGLYAMPLAEASAIAQIAPVLITLLAVRFLRETAPPGTWWALIISFTGVLLIARPGSQIFSWAAFLPLATAVLAAIYQLLTRKLSNIDDGVATLFLGGLVATIAASLVVPFYWEWPHSWIDALMFIAMGAVGAGGHMLLVRAFENAPASTLAPFGYFQVASSLVMGILVFGSFPDEWALAGMLMIVATGIVMAIVRRRQSLRPLAVPAVPAALEPAAAPNAMGRDAPIDVARDARTAPSPAAAASAQVCALVRAPISASTATPANTPDSPARRVANDEWRD